MFFLQWIQKLFKCIFYIWISFTICNYKFGSIPFLVIGPHKSPPGVVLIITLSLWEELFFLLRKQNLYELETIISHTIKSSIVSYYRALKMIYGRGALEVQLQKKYCPNIYLFNFKSRTKRLKICSFFIHF